MKSFRRIKKSLFTSVVAILLVLATVTSAGAATFVRLGDYRYAKASDTEVYVESYIGTDSKYYFTVPSNPAPGFTTVGVYDNFMMNNKNLSTVTLPDTVVEINQLSFSGCTSLKSFTMPYSLKVIENDVFRGSGLTTIKFNNSLKSIGNGAFSYMNDIKTVTFPSSVVTIGEGVFSNCSSLKFATVPRSVMEIGQGSFLNCDKNFIMYVEPNSYAQKYAEENDIFYMTLYDVKYGDVNGDCKVNIRDVTYIQKCIVGMEGFVIEPNSTEFVSADVNGDQVVDINDALQISRYINHIINKFPVEG